METDNVLLIITVLIFIMPVVVFVPALAGESTAETQEETVLLYENDTENIGQYIEVSVTEVNGSNADISVVDTDNGESDSETLQEGQTHTFSFDNGDIRVTLDNIHNDSRAVLVVNYPSEYGWGSYESQIGEFMPYMIIIPTVMILLVILYGVIVGEK